MYWYERGMEEVEEEEGKEFLCIPFSTIYISSNLFYKIILIKTTTYWSARTLHRIKRCPNPWNCWAFCLQACGRLGQTENTATVSPYLIKENQIEIKSATVPCGA